MRKVNAVITALIMILFVAHGVLGAFQMIGVGGTAHKVIAQAAFILVVVHALVGFKLTMDSWKVQRKTGVSYRKENRLYSARRISGFAILVLLVFHMTAFTTKVDGATRLVHFDAFRLACQILLVLAILVHVISNAKPMLISFGIRSLRERVFDILFVISVLLLFMAFAFVIYYLRWRV